MGIYLGPSPHCPLPACHKPVIVLGARANLYEVEHPDDQPAKFRIRAEHGYVLLFDLACSVENVNPCTWMAAYFMYRY